MRREFYCLLFTIGWLNQSALAQLGPDSLPSLPGKLTAQYTDAISGKADKLSTDLDKQSEKYLTALSKQEERMKRKLAKIDSVAANNIFTNAAAKYQSLENKLKDKSQNLANRGGQYLPWLDSAATSLNFLDKNSQIANINGQAAQIKSALSKVKELENQFRQAADIKEFIRQRKEMLTAQLRDYNFGSELKKYNQTAYYYTQQVNEYRQVLDDPDKAERKAMQLLHKLPAFQKFMREHGQLAGLFNVPADYATNMAGLQTRDQVMNIMQQQIQNMGPNAQQQMQQGISAAQAELTKLRNQFPSSGSTEDIPDFKPKEEKTKPFLKRLQYGTNIQTVRSSYFFPTTTDIGLSVGYKINEKSVIGIGMSYKMGWGKDIQHMHITSEGIGLRSFLDVRLKGSFYASGGIEYNYQQPFNPMTVFKYMDNWQQSGLIGITKMVTLKTKFFKNTKLQLFWDVLSYRQVPQTQPLKFRVGYNF